MEDSSRCSKCDSPVEPEFQFCKKCGAELVRKTESATLAATPSTADQSHSEAESPATDRRSGGTPPLKLEVKLGRKLRLGAHGILEIRVSNLTSSELEDVDLEIKSTLGLQMTSDFLFNVPIDRPWLNYLPFTVTGEGQHYFSFCLRTVDAEEYESRMIIEVSSPTASTQVINYTDARHIEGRIVVGTEGAIFPEPSQETAETDDFVVVFLKPPSQVSDDPVKRPLASFKHRRYEADRLCLQFRLGDTSFNIGLLAKMTTSLGRQRGNDIVLRVLPPSHENDLQSRHISGHHGQLEFAANGVVWRNLQCSHGTSVADRHLPEGEASLLRQGAKISPANVLSLGCELFYGDPIDTQKSYDRFAKRYARGTISDPVGKVRAVRLKRLDNLAGQEQYVIFQRVVSIGSGSSCAVFLNHPSVSQIHAQILWLGNSFWLEPLRTTQPSLANGQEIPLNQLVPLCPNLMFRLGDVEVTVTQFQQYYLDVFPTV